MITWQLNRYDRACMREWQISETADQRTPVEAEERLVLPEWIRRTQWRHFWEYHDSICAITHTPFKSQGKNISVAANSFRPRAPESRIPLAAAQDSVRRQRKRQADNRKEQVVIVALFITVTIVAVMSLCIFLSA